jgi:threonine synthase
MRYLSTRNSAHTASLSEAISRGLAPDGGLYVPEQLPTLELSDALEPRDLPALAAELIAPFAVDDQLAPFLAEIAADAFNFPAPVIEIARAPGPLSVLELFHGPTAAFKDFGARFLAASMERIPRADPRRLTILVATSGDTGGAVAAAFFERPWVDVVVLYPKGLVSARQEKQLACWGGNVRTLAVDGTFDDCQQMVKAAFVDSQLSERLLLSSANSINVGRLLPQMVYYAKASLELLRADGRAPNFIIPTGNLGNALACIWARRIGLPIGDILLATNENQSVPDFLRDGNWAPRASVPTLASAMDVGNPSNMERLRWLYPDWSELRKQVSADTVSDEEIRCTIRVDREALGQTWCPHTATAACVYSKLSPTRRAQRWVLVATAHPAKFNDIVEPLVGGTVPVPPQLAALLAKPSLQVDVDANLAALREILLESTV